METRTVDVAIVGAGSAGLSARREVQRRGKSFVLIERGEHGTTCARVGCMPSKLLIAAADARHEVDRAAQFGIRVPEGVSVDGRAVMERVRRERDRFAGFVVQSVEQMPAERRIDGQAKLIDPHTLEVDGRIRVEAQAIVLATGSRSWIPPSLEPVRDRVITNDEIFELEDIPESMAVFGTGIIGVELGQAMHRLGSRVAFFNPFPVVGPLTDPAVRREVIDVLGSELAFHLGIREEVVTPHPEGGVTVEWTDNAGRHTEHFATVLAAAGRRPNLEDLGLTEAGITVDRRGIPPFDPHTMQVGELPLFLAGDITADRPLLHEASDEGRIAGANAAMWPEIRGHVRRTPLAVVFTDPQMAVVGQHWEALRDREVVVGEASYANQGRARVMGRNAGLVRVYADRANGCLLGAEMFGPSVEHTAHLLAWTIDQRTGVERALRMPFYHPVVEEGIRTALRNAASQLHLAPKPCANELDCGPGT